MTKVRVLVKLYHVPHPRIPGHTPLHLAVVLGHSILVRMLLASGARPDVQAATSGKTGLFLAVEQGNQPLVELLLSYGGSVSIPSFSGVTQAHIINQNKLD